MTPRLRIKVLESVPSVAQQPASLQQASMLAVVAQKLNHFTTVSLTAAKLVTFVVLPLPGHSSLEPFLLQRMIFLCV